MKRISYLLIMSSFFVTSINASSLYIYNGLYGRKMKVSITFNRQKPAKEFVLDSSNNRYQKIGTIDDRAALSLLTIDIEAGASKYSEGSKEPGIKKSNIFSGTALQKAEALLKQNKDIWINVQEVPGAIPAQIGVNVLSEPLKQG